MGTDPELTYVRATPLTAADPIVVTTQPLPGLLDLSATAGGVALSHEGEVLFGFKRLDVYEASPYAAGRAEIARGF